MHKNASLVVVNLENQMNYEHFINMQLSSSEEIESDEQNREMRFSSLQPHFKTSMPFLKLERFFIPNNISSEGNILTSHNNETNLDEKLSKLDYRKEFKRFLHDFQKKKNNQQSPAKTPKISLLEVLDNTPSEHIDLDLSSQSQFSIKPDKESSYLSVNFQERKRRQSSSSFLSVNFRNTEKDKNDQQIKNGVANFRYYKNAQRTNQQKLTYQDTTKKDCVKRRKSRLSSQDQTSNKDIQIESNLYNIRRKKQLNVTSIIPILSQPPKFQTGSLLQQIQSAQRIYSHQHPEELMNQVVGNKRKNSQNSNTSTPRGILKNSSQENSRKSIGSKLSICSLNSPCMRSKQVKFSLTKKQAKQQNIPC